MKFYVKHSLPGRMRVRYDKSEVSVRQAVLAQTLLSVQEGMAQVTVNHIVGSFLIRYDETKQSEKNIKALFRALSDKYLNDADMLASVTLPPKRASLPESLISMAVWHYAKRLLPPPLGSILQLASIAPRVLKGVERIFSGRVFCADVLDATAITAAAATGDMSTASNINFLLDIGETIEEYTKKKSYEDLASTLFSENDQVQLVEGETERKVPLYTLKKGDIVAVRTGSLIPADGEVVKGEALVNQASITGEPLAVEKRKGHSVFAGTIVQEGELFVLVRATGSQTKVQNILAMIDSSQQLKVSSQVRSEKLADQLVKYNFLLSLLTFIFTGNITKVLSTLMVDYSCAMKLAAPLAVLSAMKEAAEHGILVKGGKFLEDASRADTVVFDKTGTLTAAEPKLSRIIVFAKKSEDDMLATAACLEEHFTHPVARAIVQAAEDKGLKHPERHAKVEYIVAHGIVTTLNGKRLSIGSRHFIFEDEKIIPPENLDTVAEDALDRGESLLYLAEEKRLLAAFAITDPVRADAKEIVRHLHDTGIVNCTMITGDDAGAAKTAAGLAGIDRYIAHALPEDKVAYIEKQKREGHTVIMIGDGINDAPALAAANTGVAMGDCAEITGETADIVLPSGDGLAALLKTRVMGQRLMKKIDDNNKNIIIINSALIAAGLFGFISPSLAAVLHNSSTIAFAVRAMQPLLKKE
ncbi:heavy metal translocating P-type ATPase [Treponema socranskii]|uniref:heavy metal translocating P-type ATPase n=1 Tax=Treponema socranskii TaxID=53419 RepID=UPI00360BC63C